MTRQGSDSARRAGLAALVMLTLAIAGCTTTAPPQRFYPDSGAPPWIIGGTLHGTTGDIRITVNETPVLTGSFPSFSESLQLEGEHQGRRLTADCDMQYCKGGIQCMLRVDGKPATILDFSGL